MDQLKAELVADTLIRLIRRGAEKNVRKVVATLHTGDLARFVNRMKPDEVQFLVTILKTSGRLGEFILDLDGHTASQIIGALSDEELSRTVSELSSDDAADLFGMIPPAQSECVLTLLGTSQERRLRDLLKYEKTSAGGLMSREFLALPGDTTVTATIDSIRGCRDPESTLYVYIVDSKEALIGVCSLRRLLLVDPHRLLHEIMDPSPIQIHTETDQEEVARIVQRYDLLAIPVVDKKNKLMGVITVDDVIDVIRDEQDEDIYKMAGTDVEELMYGSQVFSISRIRLPWLLLTLMEGMICAGILTHFGSTIERVIALASFVPVIMGMGGNIGTQSATITIRGLATGRVEIGNVGRALFREVRVGMILGIIMGTLVGAFAGFWQVSPLLGAVVGVCMLIAISVASVMGTIMPIIFMHFGIDPAVASGPFVTSSNDITGLVIYLGLANLLIDYLV